MGVNLVTRLQGEHRECLRRGCWRRENYRKLNEIVLMRSSISCTLPQIRIEYSNEGWRTQHAWERQNSHKLWSENPKWRGCLPAEGSAISFSRMNLFREWIHWTLSSRIFPGFSNGGFCRVSLPELRNCYLVQDIRVPNHTISLSVNLNSTLYIIILLGTWLGRSPRKETRRNRTRGLTITSMGKRLGWRPHRVRFFSFVDYLKTLSASKLQSGVRSY